MRALFASLRDPLYAASAGALVAIAIAAGAILLSTSGGDASVPPTTTATPATSTPLATPTAGPLYSDVLADTQRVLDLAEIRDALELFMQRNGSYPSTEGDFGTVCAQAFDAGCGLLSVAPDLPSTDGEQPYWLQSDGTNYTLFARVALPPDESNCPDDVPPVLKGGPVACITGGQ